MNRAVLLILANLALVGCGKKTGAGNPPPEAYKDCTGPADCTGGENTWCMKIGDAGTGKCYPQPREGRPLTVDGEIHVAPFDRAVDATRLHRAAQDEHASIAAFARTVAELMALGAPTWLLAETQTAMGDEIRHTERTLAALEELTGERPVLGRLEAATRPLARSVEDFFRDVLRGGAVGETLAAAAADRRHAEHPNALDEMIFHDESRHAALAFKTLRWLVEQKPDLRRLVAEERDALDLETRTLVSPLFEAAFG